MQIVKPPTYKAHGNTTIFLAGSIEMGKAEDWQTRVAHALVNHDVTLLNPRRDEWDSSWKQSIENPQFAEQVTWELTNLEQADAIIFYFDPKTMAPITLAELGMYIKTTKRLFICCPPGYWRRGNLEVMCARYGHMLYANLDEMLVKVSEFIIRKQGM